MKLKSKYFFFYIPLFFSIICNANDRSKVLSKNDFLNIVRKYHPVMTQAGLQVEKARANLRHSRGAFDPNISASFDRKTFDSDLYYSYLNPKLVIPTWYGIELRAGIEEVIGDRVTTETTTGQNSYLGIKLNANDILFDKRRAALRQAQTMVQMSEAERRLIVNDLLLQSLYSYWNWVQSYQKYKIISNSVSIIEQRLRFVKIQYQQGAKPAIDTSEALAQLQNFHLLQNEAYLAYQNSGLELSNYLWVDNNLPLNWDESISPDTAAINTYQAEQLPPLNSFLSVLNNHPKLQSLEYKIDVLEIDKKLKAQSFIPKLSISANMLNKGYDVPNDFSTPFLENNHKLGVNFTLPLFMRAARGSYAQARIKLQETNLDLSNTNLQIENKVKSYYNQVVALNKQIEIYSGAYQNYTRLYNGERLRFNIGESSLFLLNSRENKLLEVMQKLVTLKAKYNKVYAGLLWSSGQLQ